MQKQSGGTLTLDKSVINEKRMLRQAMSASRNAMQPEIRMQLSETIGKMLWQHVRAAVVANVMAYVPYRSEVDTRPFIEQAWREGIEVILPQCEVETRAMTLFKVRQWSELREGAYGIMEPDPELAEACGDTFVPEIIIAPGLAFGKNGARLGYGGGYYDRFKERLMLCGNSALPVWLGAAFSLQLVEWLPSERHDAMMDAVVTEHGIWRTQTDR
ncbi:5-formyltetrahydrofolate cyclo-ligase [Paenibacillaceae bacterium]|nr:5-formyltetrahydrofolate cyclo-ligase [Paenibacillaceae bacterium]